MCVYSVHFENLYGLSFIRICVTSTLVVTSHENNAFFMSASFAFHLVDCEGVDPRKHTSVAFLWFYTTRVMVKHTLHNVMWRIERREFIYNGKFEFSIYSVQAFSKLQNGTLFFDMQYYEIHCTAENSQVSLYFADAHVPDKLIVPISVIIM